MEAIALFFSVSLSSNFFCYNEQSQPDSGKVWSTRDVAIAAGTGTVVGIGTMYGVPVVAGAILKGVGFGTGGKSLKQLFFSGNHSPVFLFKV